MTTPSITNKIVACQVLNNGAKALFLYGRHRLGKMQQSYVKSDAGRIQQHILLRVIARKDRMAVRKAEDIRLSMLVNAVSVIVHRGTTVVDLLKTNLNFAVVFKKEYREKFIASRTLHMEKDIMGSVILRRMIAQFYH